MLHVYLESAEYGREWFARPSDGNVLAQLDRVLACVDATDDGVSRTVGIEDHQIGTLLEE